MILKKLSNLGLGILLLTTSCTVNNVVEDDSPNDNAPSNFYIEDSKGVQVAIEWKDQFGSVSGGLDVVDIDMYLGLNGTFIDSSATDQFEDLFIHHFYVDSTFDIVLEYDSGTISADYDIFVRGIDDPSDNAKYSNTLVNDSSLVLPIALKIHKRGPKFYIE